ncbi:mariner Mos1 transposase [Trichonephila clavipes]|nr:mariner Mos1 transposase [Trichonephila clavipes]
MGIPYLPGIKATVDEMPTPIISRQGQSQTNTVKVQDYGNSVFNQRVVLLMNFMPQGTTFNSGVYCTILRKLRRALQNKRRGMLSKGVLLLHDNARPHTSRTTQKLIKSIGWTVLDHAPYIPDLAPRDFHLFRYLKHSLSGKCFSDNEEVKAAVNSWLSNQATDFFEESF